MISKNTEEIKVLTIDSLDILQKVCNLMEEILGSSTASKRNFDFYKSVFENYPQLSVYAELNGEVIGGILARVTEKPDIGIGEVAVAANYRKLHLGSRMLRLLENNARKLKIYDFGLGGRLEAIPFYVANGYEANLFIQTKVPPTAEDLIKLVPDYTILKSVSDTENAGELWCRVMIETKDRDIALEDRVKDTFPDVILLYVCHKKISH